jgi:hypothetical protein
MFLAIKAQRCEEKVNKSSPTSGSAMTSRLFTKMDDACEEMHDVIDDADGTE